LRQTKRVRIGGPPLCEVIPDDSAVLARSVPNPTHLQALQSNGSRALGRFPHSAGSAWPVLVAGVAATSPRTRRDTASAATTANVQQLHSAPLDRAARSANPGYHLHCKRRPSLERGGVRPLVITHDRPSPLRPHHPAGNPAPGADLQVAQRARDLCDHGSRLFPAIRRPGLPNKLLVLIDGRSVYSPLFLRRLLGHAGRPADDIARIEVSAARAQTLWGSNARPRRDQHHHPQGPDTQGGFVEGEGGDQQRSLVCASRRQGSATASPGVSGSWARGITRTTPNRPAGGAAHDAWNRTVDGGFPDCTGRRVGRRVMLECRGLAGSNSAGGPPSENFFRGDLMARWRHALRMAGLLVQPTGTRTSPARRAAAVSSCSTPTTCRRSTSCRVAPRQSSSAAALGSGLHDQRVRRAHFAPAHSDPRLADVSFRTPSSPRRTARADPVQ